jgi:hypothetical protein
MSCHRTAQAPSYASMLPSLGCNQASFKKNWYRNLPGSQAFGAFTPGPGSCTKTTPTPAPLAADYSLQLASTVTRSITGSATFNAAPPAPTAPVFPVTRE